MASPIVIVGAVSSSVMVAVPRWSPVNCAPLTLVMSTWKFSVDSGSASSFTCTEIVPPDCPAGMVSVLEAPA